MAPKKRTAVDPSSRVTRSSNRLVNANSDTQPQPPKAKKPKKAVAPKKAQQPPPAEDEEKGQPQSSPEKPQSSPEKQGAEVSDVASKTIIIEHCKQCNSFKTRALKVKEGLEKAIPGVKVVVNPEKPRRGCFEVREEDGEKFISLLEMKRPFQPMKDLDMDEVISGIIEKIK
ncbi:unnamed protein product [Cuscuta epithymum]|uniref:Selenoprotein H n=1 Tax=Cuscuta epithymum TaxID=186058 RepID=A0AAV0G8R4_9ASTE|nr:unnamed protein product [Cuscuta epithymum]